jgi:hypothetical protein
MVRDLVAEDLQRALHPGARGDGSPCGAAQVRVVEVGQPVRGRPHLAAHAPLLPGHQAAVRAEPGQQCSDGVAIADDDAVHAAYLAGLAGDAEAPGGSDQRERRLRARAGHLERAGAPRLGQ